MAWLPTSIRHELSQYASRADCLYAVAFYLCLGLLPTFITLLGSRALQVPFIAIAVITAALLFLDMRHRAKFFAELRKPYLLLLMMFSVLLFAYAVWDTLHNPDHLRIFQKPLTVLLLVIVLGFLRSAPIGIVSQRLAFYLRAGIFISFIVICGETLWGYYAFDDKLTPVPQAYSILYIHKINRSLEVISVLIFMSGLASRQSRGNFLFTCALAAFTWGISFFALGTIPIAENAWGFGIHVDSETVQFGLPIALLVYVVAQKLPRFITDLVFGSICFILLTAPWFFQLFFKFIVSASLPKMREILIRAEIWDGVSRKILESPFTGYGIDSVRYLEHVSIAHKYHLPATLLHPHNMFLQIWLDIGFGGVILVLGLIIICWRTVKATGRANRPEVLASITMLSLFCLVTHSFWQTWSMALIATVSIIILTLTTARQETSGR